MVDEAWDVAGRMDAYEELIIERENDCRRQYEEALLHSSEESLTTTEPPDDESPSSDDIPLPLCIRTTLTRRHTLSTAHPI